MLTFAACLSSPSGRWRGHWGGKSGMPKFGMPCADKGFDLSLPQSTHVGSIERRLYEASAAKRWDLPANKIRTMTGTILIQGPEE